MPPLIFWVAQHLINQFLIKEKKIEITIFFINVCEL